MIQNKSIFRNSRKNSNQSRRRSYCVPAAGLYRWLRPLPRCRLASRNLNSIKLTPKAARSSLHFKMSSPGRLSPHLAMCSEEQRGICAKRLFGCKNENQHLEKRKKTKCTARGAKHPPSYFKKRFQVMQQVTVLDCCTSPVIIINSVIVTTTTIQ